MSIKDDTDPSIQLHLGPADPQRPPLSARSASDESTRGPAQEGAALKLGEHGIIIFRPVGSVRMAEVAEIYSFWGFTINLCMFSVVEHTDCIFRSPRYTLEFVCEVAHCLRFSTRQGFKGAEFLKSPESHFKADLLARQPQIWPPARLQDGYGRCAFLRGEVQSLRMFTAFTRICGDQGLCLHKSGQGSVG